jgi:hypothetical protein
LHCAHENLLEDEFLLNAANRCGFAVKPMFPPVTDIQQAALLERWSVPAYRLNGAHVAHVLEIAFVVDGNEELCNQPGLKSLHSTFSCVLFGNLIVYCEDTLPLNFLEHGSLWGSIRFVQ